MAATHPVPPDDAVLDGARRALERHGWEAATMDRIAAEAGVSRMTLHRRGVTRATLLAALSEQLEHEHREAMYKGLSAPGNARERLQLALEGECEVAEANLALMEALSLGARSAVFHEEGDEVLTRDAFTAPLQRLLTDGAADGSLRDVDVPETATLLINLVGYTYRHLRRGHGWPPERATRSIVSLVMNGVAA
jgi:AcrR family transcriptional regulator